MWCSVFQKGTSWSISNLSIVKLHHLHRQFYLRCMYCVLICRVSRLAKRVCIYHVKSQLIATMKSAGGTREYCAQR